MMMCAWTDTSREDISYDTFRYSKFHRMTSLKLVQDIQGVVDKGLLFRHIREFAVADHRVPVFTGKNNILSHLTENVDFSADDALYLTAQGVEGLLGEGPEGNGTQTLPPVR